MSKKILLILPMLLLVATGCNSVDLDQQKRAQEKQEASESLTNANSEEITVQLDAQNNSEVSGTIVFSGDAGKTKAVLLTSNVTGTVAVYSGSCGKLGPVKYALPAVQSGRAEAVLDVSIEDMINEVPLAVSVQRGNVSVACGDISRSEN